MAKRTIDKVHLDEKYSHRKEYGEISLAKGIRKISNRKNKKISHRIKRRQLTRQLEKELDDILDLL